MSKTGSPQAGDLPSFLRAAAVDRPAQAAYIFTDGAIRYDELDRQSDICARGLAAMGIERGDRVALLVRPSRSLFVLAFGLLRRGAVPVLIDPGIGRVHLARCLAEARPSAFIGVSVAHAARVLLGWARDSVRTLITVGARWFWSGASFDDVMTAGAQAKSRPFPSLGPNELAAIAFTSGSTGPPKGAMFTHENLAAQALLLRDHFGIRPGERDLATFPLFAFFDPVWQATAVIPRMDFTRPGSVNPPCIIEPVLEHGVTHAFGSPALLDRVGRWGVERAVKLPSLKRVLSAGAPVSGRVLERFAQLLGPDAEIHTPYGATEALPICSISLRELRGDTADETARGRGVCVGRPLPQVRLEVIRITDAPIENWSDDLRVPRNEVGELVVWGPNVSREYWNRPEATRLAKIFSEAGEIGHRTGDVGSIDTLGRVWFCGRKAHRVVTGSETLFSVACEGVFNQHPHVRRTALVGVGAPPRQRPALCVEVENDGDRSQIKRDLLALGAACPSTRNVETILFHHRFPVDIRHNAKIFRERLAVWASGRIS
ncbi:MAG TPA: fatty acid CoA ligase family protein [Terrimicrobiaceae bacterium]